MATIGSEAVQVEALDSNSIVIGGETFVRFTAFTYDVETADGGKLLIDSEKVIYVTEDNVPVSIPGGYMVIDEEVGTEYTVGDTWDTAHLQRIDVQTGEVYYNNPTTQQLVNSQTNLGHNIYAANIPIDCEGFEPIPLLANGNPVYMKDTDFPIYLMPFNTDLGLIGILRDMIIERYSNPIELLYINKP